MGTEDLRVELRGVTKRYTGTLALDHVDFDLVGGEIHAIVGENGAGKSTLIKILTGFESSDAGEIRIDGQLRSVSSPRDAEDLGISVVYQDLTLVPEFTALQNIFLGHELKTLFGRPDWQTMRNHASERLSDLNVSIELDVPVDELTRADQQIVMIVRALSQDMRVLILDEVTGAIPKEEEDRLFEFLDRLRTRGNIGVVYISHRLEEVVKLADRVSVLTNGRNVASFSRGEYTMTNLISAIVGERTDGPVSAGVTEYGGIALKVTGLCGEGVDDVDLSVRAGEIVGITGLIGSGKEALARVLFGILPKTGGTVELFGEAVTVESPHDAIDRGLFLIPEDRQSEGLVLEMSSKDNLTLSRLGRVAGLLGLIRSRKEYKLADEYVTALGIDHPGLRRPVSALSGGNQQRVVVGKGIFTESSVYIFVSPTHGVDVGARRDIYDVIRTLCRDEKAAVLLVSSEIPEIKTISDRVLIMKRGRLVAEMRPSDVSEEAVHQ